MTEVDRIDNNDSFNFVWGWVPSFVQFCEKRLQPTRKQMEFVHSDGSATFQ